MRPQTSHLLMIARQTPAAEKVIGTAEQYPKEAFAAEAVEALRRRVNRAGIKKLAGPKTFAGLVDRYRLKELADDYSARKRRKTRQVYESKLRTISYQDGAVLNFKRSPALR